MSALVGVFILWLVCPSSGGCVHLVGVSILWWVFSSSGWCVYPLVGVLILWWACPLFVCVGVSFICAPFPLAVWVEREFQCDRYLATHARYYIREMRIKAYTQLLESYRSVSLVHMAKSFGVGVEFMDR